MKIPAALPLSAKVSGRLRVLILVRYFTPAYKAGGPVRSIENLVALLGAIIEFKIICLNRDHSDSTPLPGVLSDEWVTHGNASVCYVKADCTSPAPLMRRVRETEFDVLYLNSFFDPLFAMLPVLLMRVGWLPQRPIVLAPRGEFSAGALALKAVKKRVYIWTGKALGLFRALSFQASNDDEASAIRSALGTGAAVRVAANITSLVPGTSRARTEKREGHLDLVFLSRISPMKNLLGVIAALKQVKGEVTFDLWGPRDDEAYWMRCEAQIALLPTNVTTTYRGVAKPAEVRAILSRAELFALPTLGENFGHAIFEALAAGCPVVVSDRTPWRGLESLGVGNDVPLEDPGRLRDALQGFVDMGPAAYGDFARRCVAFAAERFADTAAPSAHIQLFGNAAHAGKCSTQPPVDER